MNLYVKPSQFSGKKFSTRYGLDTFAGDFGATTIDGIEYIFVRPLLPDDPPIFEAPDPLIPAPPGIFVHEMRALSKKQGTSLIDGDGTVCLHIVVDTETKLSDPWFNGVAVDVGSVAYIMDKSKIVVWDGAKWK